VELEVALLADLGRLTDAIAQVVELGSTHIASVDELKLCDDWRVDGEGALDTHARAELANRERLVDPRAPTSNDDAFEDLNALFVALYDSYVHLDGVAGLEIGNVVAKTLLINKIGDVHRTSSYRNGEPGGFSDSR